MEPQVMAWTQFTIFFIGVFGLFIWNRTESRADSRHHDAQLNAIRGLMQEVIKESKDFHGRLCALEERNKYE
jgi:hypothetical protein